MAYRNRAGLVDSDSDDEYDQRQQDGMVPWERLRPPQDGHGRNACLHDPDSETYQARAERYSLELPNRKGASTWAGDVRDGWARGTYHTDAAGRHSGKDRYGTADVGHVFAVENKGSNSRGNCYMQDAAFNRCIGNNYDELNAAMVGYSRTSKAMKESKKHGMLNEERWSGWESDEVTDLGKEKFKAVGVLTKKNGGIDRRCPAVVRKEVVVDQYGIARGLKKKAEEIRALEKRGEFDHLYASEDDDDAVDELSRIMGKSKI